MKPKTLAGFEVTFQEDGDPWRTFSDRDEARKRRAILHALGSEPIGRVLELAAGNGSNSVPLAARALRLDATEGTEAGTNLVAGALGGGSRHRAVRLVLPGAFPRRSYDAVIVAELLYYLPGHVMNQIARDVAAAIRPGGRLVLAHHRIDFHDFAQKADDIHARFLRATGARWRRGVASRTGRWQVEGYARVARPVTKAR